MNANKQLQRKIVQANMVQETELPKTFGAAMSKDIEHSKKYVPCAILCCVHQST